MTTGQNGDDGRGGFAGFSSRQQRIGTRGHLTRSRHMRLSTSLGSRQKRNAHSRTRKMPAAATAMIQATSTAIGAILEVGIRILHERSSQKRKYVCAGGL